MSGSVGRSRWLALGGLGLTAIGRAWDAAWHSRSVNSSPNSAEEVFEAHWLMLLGVGVMLVFLAVNLRTTPRDRLSLADWLALLGASSMVVGFTWDSIRHVQGTESPIGHGLIYWGAPLVAIGLPVAIFLAYRRAAQRAPGADIDQKVNA